MPRRARLFMEGTPVHVVQRGNNRQACFYGVEDFQKYLECLQNSALQEGCDVHAYVLMTNHVHLLATPHSPESLPRMMQGIGRRYVRWINSRYRRTGTLWEGRYKTSLVQTGDYVLMCYRYIELNPVRACMVKHPGEYPWSSFQHNGLGQGNLILRHHEQYRSLAHDFDERCTAYRELFRQALTAEQIDLVNVALKYEFPLGDSRFRAEIERANRIKVVRPARGRPGKETPDSALRG